MRTTNPALRPKLLEKYASVPSDQAMTVEGTINKAGLLLFLLEWRQPGVGCRG